MPFEYNVKQHPETLHWHVEKIDEADGGTIQNAIFVGPLAEQRAKDYAAMMNRYHLTSYYPPTSHA